MDAVIKRLYLVNGNLTQPLDKNDENIAVDTSTAAQLQTLGIGDWCYLTLIEQGKLEVVKITRFPNWFWVDRGQDGTIQYTFSIAASIVYKLTSQEIQDAVNYTPLSIYPNGYGAINVSQGVNSWGISYTAINLQAIGSLSWMNPDGYEIVIVDNDGMYGCCDGNLTGAAYAGGVPFYLTSQLYAVYGMDSGVSSTPNTKSGVPQNPFGDVYLLDKKFSSMDEYVSPKSSLLDMNIYGGLIIISNGVDKYVAPQVVCLDMNIFGGIKTYSGVENTQINPTCYILEMLLFGNEINYIGADKYVSPSVAFLDASVS